MTKGILLGVVATCLVAFVIWLGVAYTGVYNVAASDTQGDAVRWTLETTMHRSVASRAGEDGVDVPDSFPQETIAAGAEHYAESCAHCHGAPGSEAEDWAQGMHPEPPHLVEAASEWSADEIYWIVSHGIKMTGMPAFGGHHDEQEIAAITAFVNRLPGLTAEDYRRLTRDANVRTSAAE